MLHHHYKCVHTQDRHIIIRNGKRTQLSTIQGVIGQVISNQVRARHKSSTVEYLCLCELAKQVYFALQSKWWFYCCDQRSLSIMDVETDRGRGWSTPSPLVFKFLSRWQLWQMEWAFVTFFSGMIFESYLISSRAQTFNCRMRSFRTL